MKKICFELPTIDQVEFDLTAEIEHTPIRGNAMASGDDKADKRAEDSIIRQLDNGNQWAWCCARVKATYKGVTAVQYLGCCSYKDENDFKRGGYYEDMKQEVYDDLIKQLEQMAE